MSTHESCLKFQLLFPICYVCVSCWPIKCAIIPPSSSNGLPRHGMYMFVPAWVSSLGQQPIYMPYVFFYSVISRSLFLCFKFAEHFPVFLLPWNRFCYTYSPVFPVHFNFVFWLYLVINTFCLVCICIYVLYS